jgi:hypothetical protein
VKHCGLGPCLSFENVQTDTHTLHVGVSCLAFDPILIHVVKPDNQTTTAHTHTHTHAACTQLALSPSSSLPLPLHHLLQKLAAWRPWAALQCSRVAPEAEHEVPSGFEVRCFVCVLCVRLDLSTYAVQLDPNIRPLDVDDLGCV